MKPEDREKMIVYGIVWPFLLCMVMFVVVVLMNASAHEPVKPNAPTWQPREIPQCDKELWERITDGCDDADTIAE